MYFVEKKKQIKKIKKTSIWDAINRDQFINSSSLKLYLNCLKYDLINKQGIYLNYAKLLKIPLNLKAYF